MPAPTDDSDMDLSDGDDELLVAMPTAVRAAGPLYTTQALLRLSASPLLSRQRLTIKPLKEWEYEGPTHLAKTANGEQQSPPHRTRVLDGNRTASARRRPEDGRVSRSHDVETPFGQGPMGDFKLPPSSNRNSNRSRPLGEEVKLSNDSERFPARSDKETDDRRRPVSAATYLTDDKRKDARRPELRPNERRSEKDGQLDGDNGKSGTFGRRDGRAEEAGWTSASSGIRERRFPQSQSAASKYERYDRSDQRTTNPRERRDNAPAWMDDEEPNTASTSETPLWASSDPPEKGSSLEPAANSSRSKSASAVADSAINHVDEIQAFKAQMREMERRQRELDAGTQSKDKPEPPQAQKATVDDTPQGKSNNEIPKMDESDSKSMPTVFKDPAIQQQTTQEGPPGGNAPRGSRFAKYFKGDPQPAQSHIQPPQQIASPPSLPSLQHTSTSPPVQQAAQNSAPPNDMSRVMEMLRLSSQPLKPKETVDPIQQGRAQYKERSSQGPPSSDIQQTHARSPSSGFFDQPRTSAPPQQFSNDQRRPPGLPVNSGAPQRPQGITGVAAHSLPGLLNMQQQPASRPPVLNGPPGFGLLPMPPPGFDQNSARRPAGTSNSQPNFNAPPPMPMPGNSQSQMQALFNGMPNGQPLHPLPPPGLHQMGMPDNRLGLGMPQHPNLRAFPPQYYNGPPQQTAGDLMALLNGGMGYAR